MATVSHASIHVYNGEELGETPQLSVQILGKRGPRSGETLLVFLDLPGASPSTCTDIIRVLTDAYAHAPGGVTSALRLSIKVANERAVQLNKGALPAQRVEGSLSCAVVNDESVVLAQAGPAIAYVCTLDGAFERIGPQGAAGQQLIGQTGVPDVSFDNVTHQAGSLYILTGDRSYSNQSDSLIQRCLQRANAMSAGVTRIAAGFINANIKNGRMTGVVFAPGSRPLAEHP